MDIDHDLDLNLIPKELRAKARELFIAGDPSFIALADNVRCLSLVCINAPILLERGIFEEVLLDAISGTRTNHSALPLCAIETMLRRANKEKIRAAGDPLPGPGPFTLYRGVAGRTRSRRIRGVSWTGNFEKAVWFANRFGLADPAVYKVLLDAEHVMARLHSGFRNEDEYVVLLPNGIKMERMEVPSSSGANPTGAYQIKHAD